MRPVLASSLPSGRGSHHRQARLSCHRQNAVGICWSLDRFGAWSVRPLCAYHLPSPAPAHLNLQAAPALAVIPSRENKKRLSSLITSFIWKCPFYDHAHSKQRQQSEVFISHSSLSAQTANKPSQQSPDLKIHQSMPGCFVFPQCCLCRSSWFHVSEAQSREPETKARTGETRWKSGRLGTVDWVGTEVQLRHVQPINIQLWAKGKEKGEPEAEGLAQVCLGL